MSKLNLRKIVMAELGKFADAENQYITSQGEIDIVENAQMAREEVVGQVILWLKENQQMREALNIILVEAEKGLDIIQDKSRSLAFLKLKFQIIIRQIKALEAARGQLNDSR